MASVGGPCATCSWLRERHEEWRTVYYCGHSFDTLTERRLAEMAVARESAQPACLQYANADKAALWQPT